MSNYVFWTDKGYIKGDLRQGVEFVEKSEARKFTEIEANLYSESIAADMFDFYECHKMRIESES